MKRLLVISCLLLAVLIFGASQVLAQVSYLELKPRGYVNDFANIIPDNIEQKLEQSLRDYQVKTTNEVVVVTVVSLEGLTVEQYTMGLAESWGVGKKGKDNGVILLVALNDRKFRIEVGYGLEPVLTDAKSKQILDAMTPYFKSSDYGRGIELGVQKICDTIGYLSPEEIAAQQKEKEARDQATLATFLFILMWVVLAIILVVVGVIIGRKVSVWNKEKKRRNHLRGQGTQLLQTAKDDLAQLLADIVQKPGDKKYPLVLNEKQNRLISDGVDLKKSIEAAGEMIKLQLKKDPDTGWAQTLEVQKTISGFREKSRMLKADRSAFDGARQSHGKILSKAVEATKNVSIYFTELARKGYALSPDKELVAANNELKIAQNILAATNDVPDYRLVVGHAEEAVKRAETVRNSWEKRLSVQRCNEQSLKQIRQWHKESFPLLVESWQGFMEKLRTSTPVEVWKPVFNDAEQKRIMIATEFGNLINTAEHLNDMNEQKFEMAAESIENISALKKAGEVSLAQAGKTLQGFAEARAKAKTLSVQASGFINRAESAINAADTEGAGRGKLQKAKEEVSKAGKLEKSDLPNWLLVVTTFTAAISLAQNAESEAKNRAEEIESARRRRREQERRRREEEDSHHSSAWSSSSSSFSSSSSSFGGFGGGSFGGGGASGSW